MRPFAAIAGKSNSYLLATFSLGTSLPTPPAAAHEQHSPSVPCSTI